MGYSDKMCYEVAKDIINTIFWEKYILTIDRNKQWYENLNAFIVNECKLIHSIEEEEEEEEEDDADDGADKFTDKEEDDILYNAFHILMDKLEIEDDEYEDHEDDICWDRFDAIVSYYMNKN
jgi:hypothetical protein